MCIKLLRRVEACTRRAIISPSLSVGDQETGSVNAPLSSLLYLHRKSVLAIDSPCPACAVFVLNFSPRVLVTEVHFPIRCHAPVGPGSWLDVSLCADPVTSRTERKDRPEAVEISAAPRKGCRH
ncbi:hypothetical protein BaRGS_00035627 [Batillaria attramentaria]|uniref:Uncharacterized protein n=1 Tax=Batillaria attramentaria TaxID=370345 RepID=A0ABD0JE60_9CAEN